MKKKLNFFFNNNNNSNNDKGTSFNYNSEEIQETAQVLQYLGEVNRKNNAMTWLFVQGNLTHIILTFRLWLFDTDFITGAGWSLNETN